MQTHDQPTLKVVRPPALNFLLLTGFVALATACGTTTVGEKRDSFFTSGDPEADQRASQRMAQAEQIESSENGDNPQQVPALEEGKLSLYARLGSEAGISNIVADFLPRALNDPRINWQRRGITDGGFLRPDKSVAWNPSQENVAWLERHLIQFLSLASGGPAQYGGEDMKSVHADLHITNAEFDATVGDLKATLDKLKVADREQKELLAIVESTRSQVVTER